jgi:hypothetical protein
MTKTELLAKGAASTERADDNSGTYVLDRDGNRLAFISNSEHEDGVWLYFSSDVREWLGLVEAA